MVGKLLIAVAEFLAHQADRIELFFPAFRETERWQHRLGGGKRQGLEAAEPGRVNLRDLRLAQKLKLRHQAFTLLTVLRM